MAGPTYTLREIARELNLPESTIRYYRDAFAAYIPTVGLGRRRRYPTEALDLFRTIADGYSQNMSRETIEANLPTPTHVSQTTEMRPGALRLHRQAMVPQSTEIIALMDGERERRDVMWQLAREIVRIGEVLERQQLALMQITQHLEWGANRALPPVPGLPVPYTGAPVAVTPEPARPDEQELARELGSLREELQRERELVERLRRAKLEIERRATNAEKELQHRSESPDLGALRRFLSKDER